MVYFLTGGIYALNGVPYTEDREPSAGMEFARSRYNG